MSRPFSYSDENFTVIGNVLFCHIKIKKAILENEPIVEIPPEIYARMLFFTQSLNKVSKGANIIAFSSVKVGVNNKNDKKYFLFSNNPIYETGTFLVGYYILKNI